MVRSSKRKENSLGSGRLRLGHLLAAEALGSLSLWPRSSAAPAPPRAASGSPGLGEEKAQRGMSKYARAFWVWPVPNSDTFSQEHFDGLLGDPLFHTQMQYP